VKLLLLAESATKQTIFFGTVTSTVTSAEETGLFMQFKAWKGKRMKTFDIKDYPNREAQWLAAFPRTSTNYPKG
jgi:hypothetical protein